MKRFTAKSAALASASVLGALLLMVTAASAAPITFFGEDEGLGEGSVLPAFPNSSAAQAAFLASLVNPGVETFEGIAGGTGAPLGINFAGAGVTATLTGNGEVVSLADGVTNGVGRYGVTNDPDNDERYWDASDDFSIMFDNPVAAFGFFGIDIGDFEGQVIVTTAGGLNMVFNIPSTGINGGGVLFWGLVDPVNTFTSVAFSNTAAGIDFFGFDDFTVGSLEQVRIPEPSTLLLLGLGLAGLCARRRT